jgi:hypothetical protein
VLRDRHGSRVARLMRELGIESVSRHRGRKRTTVQAEAAKAASDLLERRFVAELLAVCVERCRSRSDDCSATLPFLPRNSIGSAFLLSTMGGECDDLACFSRCPRSLGVA